jgi:3,4-dihydroxy 2-butanone 4-phosphate synthase / GTP cyclohydrolase II
MTSLLEAVEDFAADELVLVGGERDLPLFVAVPAQALDAMKLDRLEQLGQGPVVLALEATIADQLQLPASPISTRSRLTLPFTASIDAARGIGGGWSLADRALTMRLVADPQTDPTDLAMPGHVHPARVSGDELLERESTVAAALELARISDRHQAVALCAVVDNEGAFVPIAAARGSRRLSGLRLAQTDELRASRRADRAQWSDVSCALPTRRGLFRVVAHHEELSDVTTLALVHGDPQSRREPLVYVHRSCLLADTLGSLLCSCRAELDQALARILEEGAGILIYAKPSVLTLECGTARTVDAPVMAGLLRRAGTATLRLSGDVAPLAGQLRALGLTVAEHRELPTAA